MIKRGTMSHQSHIPAPRFHFLLHLLTANVEIEQRPQVGGSGIAAKGSKVKIKSGEHAIQTSLPVPPAQVPTFLRVLLELGRERIQENNVSVSVLPRDSEDLTDQL